MVKKIVISYNVHEYLMFRRFIHDYFQFSTIDNICTDVYFHYSESEYGWKKIDIPLNLQRVNFLEPDIHCYRMYFYFFVLSRISIRLLILLSY
jgi:hypothetical protein